jgi:HSP20 family molecular chaperone IbpA
VAYNFDEFFRRVLQMLREIIDNPEADHPLKHIFSNEDLERIAKNPPSMEDISKFMQYFFGNPNFNPFSQNNPFYKSSSPPPSAGNPPPEPKSETTTPEADIIIDTFKVENQIHILVGTNRTDLEFKTGISKNKAKENVLIIRNKNGIPIRIVKLPAKIEPKSKQIIFQNGTYEVIYTKKK